MGERARGGGDGKGTEIWFEMERSAGGAQQTAKMSMSLCRSALEQIIPTAGESERGPGEKSERPKSGFETVADSAGAASTGPAVCQEQRAAEDEIGVIDSRRS